MMMIITIITIIIITITIITIIIVNNNNNFKRINNYSYMNINKDISNNRMSTASLKQNNSRYRKIITQK